MTARTLPQLGMALVLTLAALPSAAQAPVANVAGGSLEQRLATLERLIEARNSAQMNLLNQVNQLQDEVLELRGISEEHSYQLEQLLQRQRELYQEIDRRLAAPAPAQPRIDTSMPMATTDTSSTSANSDYSSNLSENDAYDRAIKLVLEDKRYEAAIPAFNDFIQRFPNSTYTPNAHYWLGQLYFSEGKYAEAKQQFETVVNQYPDSNKRADCMLKLGAIAQQAGETQTARTLYEQIVSEYATSTEANLAKQRLAEM